MDPFKTTGDMMGEREQNLSTKAYDVLLNMLINCELPVNTVLQERRQNAGGQGVLHPRTD